MKPYDGFFFPHWQKRENRKVPQFRVHRGTGDKCKIFLENFTVCKCVQAWRFTSNGCNEQKTKPWKTGKWPAIAISDNPHPKATLDLQMPIRTAYNFQAVSQFMGLKRCILQNLRKTLWYRLFAQVNAWKENSFVMLPDVRAAWKLQQRAPVAKKKKSKRS